MKKAKTKTSHKFLLKKTHSIGSPDAETDTMLMDVFIDIPNLEEILDVESQKSILIGRTGSGKSAIIKYLKTHCENITCIEPESMSLRFLSNSTALRHFKELGVNLTLFYKVLWKHVFIVELLKLNFQEELNSSKGKFQQFVDFIKSSTKKSNPRRDRAIGYLEKWSKDFWLSTEYQVKSLEKGLVEKYETSLGLSIEQFHGKSDNHSQHSEKVLIDAKQKAEKVIHDSQSEELLEIVSIMKEDFFTNHQRKFYIVMDDLDKEWIEDEYRFDLIGAMVEVIKEFRSFYGVKIVICLRENLNELVFSGHQNKGGQREKIKPLYSRLAWDKEDLKQLLNSRLKKLSGNQLHVKNAFYSTRRNHENGLDYVLERTYDRPRDVISFINHVLENANNKKSFTKDLVSKGEALYSLDRFHALEDEWGENYGQFGRVCYFLKNSDPIFAIKSINQNQFTDVYCDESNSFKLSGELLEATQKWRNEKINFTAFLKKLLYILFRIGVIGIKKGPKDPIAFYYSTDVLVGRNDFTNSAKFYIHKALYSYFRVNSLDQLPEE